MKQLKRITLLLMTFILIGTMSLTAFAAEGNQKGSLTVTIKRNEQILAGGSIKLSQIASFTQDNGEGSYVYTEEFAASGVPLSNVQAENLTPEKAVVWSTYADQQNVPGTEIEVGEDGTASASELEPGLYLIQQGTAAQGYVMSGTVVPLPLQEDDGSMNYIVEAVPKVVGENSVGRTRQWLRKRLGRRVPTQAAARSFRKPDSFGGRSDCWRSAVF